MLDYLSSSSGEKGESAAKRFFTDEMFRGIFDHFVEDMEEKIRTGINAVEPRIMGLMIDDDDEQVVAQAILSELPEDFDERQEVLHIVGAKLVEASRAIPIAIFAVSEAWMWQGKDPEDSFLSYEEHGERNRSEVIILSAQTLDDRKLSVVYVITRGEKNVIVLERKLPLIVGDDVGGEHNRFIQAVYEGGAEWMMKKIVKNVRASGKTIKDLVLDDTTLSDAIDNVFDDMKKHKKGDNHNGHLN